MKRLMRIILTNYIFKFMFWNEGIKNGDLLECQGDLFIFDDTNGNPGKLKNYYKTNGFWNYIKAKEDSIYSSDLNRFLTKDDCNSQGYKGLEYYKNCIYPATLEQIELYNNIVKRLNYGNT